MTEYLVTLQRVVECDDPSDVVELCRSEIDGAGGLEALGL